MRKGLESSGIAADSNPLLLKALFRYSVSDVQKHILRYLQSGRQYVLNC